jgi:hypothetical protein
MLKNKILFLLFLKFNLTIVAALNAEPKSIPIICPDDVSIRKLNKSIII